MTTVANPTNIDISDNTDGIEDIVKQIKNSSSDSVLKNGQKDNSPPSGLSRTKTSINISEEKVANISASEEKGSRQRKEASYVGWKQIGGWEESDALTAEDELLDLNKETPLDNFIPDKFYGDWYHSVAIFAIGGILSFTIGYFKLPLSITFFVIIVSSVFYRISVKTYRASIRDLVQREFTVQNIDDDYESMEWVNNFLDKFWPKIEPNVSQMVVAQVNDLLATNEQIPAFIKALWIDQFTLGVKPPRIDLVKTFQNTDNDVVVMDWGVSFTPHDLTDLNAKQMKNFINQKCVIKAKLFGLTLPVSVSDIAFKATARISLKLMTPFPHVETANVQLLEVPDIDFYALLFGDSIFNTEVLAIPGLMTMIQKMAKKYMAPMLLPPFSLQFNIPQLLSGSALSIGVLEVTVKNAKNIRRASTLVGDSIDPYLMFEINGKKTGKTRIVRDTLNPVWNETLYILLGTFTDPLSITLWDKREKLKDKVLGRIEYNLNSLHDAHFQRNINVNFLRNSRSVGELNLDLHFYPTLTPKVLPDGTEEGSPDLNTGISKIVIEEAYGLDKPGNKVCAYVEVYSAGELLFSTDKAEGIDVIKWNKSYESVIMDRRKTKYKIVVKNSKNGEVISSTLQSLNDLIDRTEIDRKRIPLNNCKGQLKITVYWKPVAMDLGSSAIAYTPPIGVVRIFINKAWDLKNLETIGKIDPYVNVLVNGVPKGRTPEIEQTLSPVWNTAIYVAVTSPNQRITLDCMDVETADTDRSVGKVDLKVLDLFQKDENDKYMKIINDEPITSRLITKKGIKGSIRYSTSFYPALPVLTLEEIEDLDQIKEKKKKLLEKKFLTDEAQMTAEQKEKFKNQENAIQDMEEMYGNKEQLDLSQLISYNSGVLSISVLDGELPIPGLYVQAFFDANGYARFTSPKISTRTIKTGWTGDVMIKELEWSITTLRVTKHKNNNKVEECLCEVTIPTIELVKNCFYRPSFLNLAGAHTAKLMIQTSWFPIDTDTLPESDLIVNTGDLTITVKGAENLISADNNGFSDPYVKLYLNDEEDCFFKSKTQKKQLNPTWNETTTIVLDNRVNEKLRIKVMDWDAGNFNDLIGTGVISLSDVKPSGVTNMDVPITDPDGGDGGVLHLSFEFDPKYALTIKKKETKVGDFASKSLGTGLRVGTTVVGAGLGTGLKAGSTVVDTFGSVGKFGIGLFGKKKNKHDASFEPEV
ncbi:hypothetical protein TPHA_0C02910 [Tetrapisispora phaffii CBS 4417]|uniref:Tricalbin n=1 Tax=Tetrapisispora phaffii (strain ATCC 24235 / CBS 4417 / NBRC 1672 / NRRL Y-8282 / UCD 70-5) TaxID=1071381 RepID=G8BRR8_TETPH|nr:hypothetical protein TPHA_0C02910 [Tetrapisispora phaffii CBS 4417]CCE62444.1 hypothetical protein TPHA_0C02910 [Tetrapisispora phaffii CBS 4417]